MYGISDALPRLSAAEEAVMLAVWQCKPPVAAAEAARLLQNGWAGTTLLTVLDRLCEKGWLKKEKQGSRSRYYPAVTLRAYRVAVVHERLNTVYGGSLQALLEALLSEAPPSQGELHAAQGRIQQAIDAAEDYDLYDPYG